MGRLWMRVSCCSLFYSKMFVYVLSSEINNSFIHSFKATDLPLKNGSLSYGTSYNTVTYDLYKASSEGDISYAMSGFSPLSSLCYPCVNMQEVISH
jgi:hypothetical protein